jgi:predicted phage tail protein
MNESKDSLRSKATLAILDLLGEGPIGGLVNGLKSVYLNNTPVENQNGTKNFQGVSWDIRGGINDQPVMPGYGNYIESPYSVSAQIKTTTPYTFSVSRSDADAVRVIVSTPSLTTTNGENGDITGATVQYKFEVSTNNGATWAEQYADYVWVESVSWATEGGYLTANAPSAAYYGLRATIVATSTVVEYATITVQPQEFNGTSWQNIGAPKAMQISYSADEFGYSILGDSYTVESQFNKVRFVVVGNSSQGGFVQAAVPTQNWMTGMTTQPLLSKAGTTTVTISGKSRSRYQRSHVLRLTPGPNTRIRVSRITADSTSALVQNDLYLDSYAEIVSLNMAYPNSALFGIRLDSEQFGGSIPSRSYLVDGLYIRVPVNYDPVSRTYSGVWNGTFKYAISNNPAWIMFDVLTHKRYGLGNFISDSQVDKATLYTIGRYCDELVPDGFGGTEPRFTLNTVIANSSESYKLVSDIASVFRGMGFWDGGMVNFTQDAPADPTMLYTAANVIDGEFSYSGSARKDRHSVVHVTWNDPQDNYKQRVEYVEDAELVALYGVRKIDTLAFGCTSRGQATRVGKWILYTEKYESDLISFRVGLDSAFVMPGNIIKIHDPNRAGRRSAGRLVSSTSTSATLDNPATITGPTTISIMMPDGSFADRQLFQSSGTHSTVTWSAPLTQTPVANAVWMMSEPNLEPVLARVIGVSQGQNPSEFDIAALEHNPTKFNAIEQGWALQDRKTSIIDATFVQTPAQLYVTEARYKAAPGVFANKLMIFWYGDSTQYEVAYRGVSAGNASNWTTVRVSDGLSYEVPNVAVGTYEVSVVGINPLGKRSGSATGTYTVVGKLTPPSNVSQFFAAPNAQGIELSWVPIADEDVKAYEVRTCTVAGQSWEAATKLIETPLTTYQVPPAASGTYQWLIKAIDTNGNYSATATRVSVTTAAPGTVTPTYAYSLADIVVSWGAATAGSLPIKHYIVKRGATWATAVDVGTTTDLSYKTRVTWTTTQLMWVAAVDIAGSVGTATSVSAVFALPTAPTLSNSQKETNYILEWTTPTSSLPISAYEVRYGSSFANGVKIGTINGNQLTIPITWLGSRTFWVAGIDLNGNVGTAGSRALTVLAPRAPASFGAVYNQSQITISWADSAETLPIDFYEVRRGADWTTGTVVGKAYTNTLTLEVSWAESATFTARATDINGNQGPIGTYINTIGVPGAVSVAHQFKDGNAILTWAAPSTGSLPIRHYEVREGATWATASLVGITSDRLYSVPVNWTSSKTFFVAAVDTAGSYGPAGSRVVTFVKYDAPTSLTATISQANVTLSWQSAANGSLDISYYDIRHGTDWDTGEVIGKANTTTITLPITWLGDRKLWVTAVDSNKQFGLSASVISSVSAPGAPSVSSTVVVAKAELTWTAPNSTLPIREYEIRHGASWAAGTVVATTLSTTYRAPVEWLGSRTYWIAARDVNGNVGTAGSTAVSVTAPTAPTVSGSFSLDEFKLNWTDPSSTLPIDEYEIRYGTSWAAGTVLGRVKGTTISTKAQWVGSRTWWVAAIDVNGNVGAAGSAALVITAPSKPSLTQQVVDNNVLLYWTQPSGTLPVVTNELRRGPTWATAEPIGQKAGGFTTVFETVAGTYTYWVAGVDSAGNIGTPGDVTTSVSQPPDYALKANNDSTFNGTKSNMYLDTDGSYILPVNTTETFEQHFTSRSWTTPNAQIAAGYPVFIQPANSPGYYEEVIDYGTPIGGTKVTVTPTGSVVAGNPAITINISVKLNAGDAWTDYNGISSVFVNNFRYVKVRLTVTGDNLSLCRITKLNVKLDTKVRNEAGMNTASATDAVSGNDAIINGVSLTGVNPNNSFGVRVPDGAGTMIRFGTPFIDITAVEISLAAGSSARYGLYDFVDTPNAAGFKVLLYDGAGNRVGGAFSWSVKGY